MCACVSVKQEGRGVSSQTWGSVLVVGQLIQHKHSETHNERQRLEGDLVDREPLTEYKKGDQPWRAELREQRELSKAQQQPQSQNWNLSPEAMRTQQLFPVLVMW